GKITAKVIKDAPMKIDNLTLKRVFPDGKSEKINILAQVMGDFIAGSTINIIYAVPPSFKSDAKLYLEDDYFSIVGNPLLAEVKSSAMQNKGFQKAEIVNLGVRPMLRFGEELYYPALIQTYDTGRRLKPEAEAGYKNFFIRIDFPEFWMDEDVYNFNLLDLKVCDLLNVIPDAIFILDIRYYMPNWWLKANPDHVSKTDSGVERLPYENEQSLGSKKWLVDSDKAIKALMKHVKSQAWCSRIWGVNVGESRNGEWFWGMLDKNNKHTMYGYSKSDYETFRNMLREKYKTNEALQAAWKQPGVTFETAKQPVLKDALKEGQGIILNPETDMPIIDWYVFRNRVFAEAIIHFCKLIKQESDGKLLCGAYYGYLIELVENYSRSQQHHGHNEFYQVSASPYVDFLRAPARYTYKKVGMPGGFMQPFTTNSLNKVLCLMENDERNSYAPHETWNFDLYTSRTSTNIQSIGNINREFAVSTVTGHAPYWKNLPRGAFYEKPVLDVIRNLKETYENLPPVQGYINNDVAVVGDGDSVYHTSSTIRGSALPAAYRAMFIHLNKLAVAYSVPVIQDMLQKDFLPPHKLYVMLPTISLTKEQREQLMARFEREKASVLWLYAAGAVYPDKPGPKPEFNGDFLGMKFTMDEKLYRGNIVYTYNGKQDNFTSEFKFGPHFYPVDGYDKVLFKDSSDRPVLVCKKLGNSMHYFSTLPDLPVPVMDQICSLAGAVRYAEGREDPVWAGNDLVFVVARTGGEKRLIAPKGTHFKAIVGPLTGNYASNEPWEAIPGMTYGFLLEKGEIAPRAKEAAKPKAKESAPNASALKMELPFVGADGAMPQGWSYNTGMKVDGKVSGNARMENGCLHFTSGKQFAAVFTSKPIPVDKRRFFKAKAKVSGKGRFSVCIYQYNEKGGYMSEPRKDYMYLSEEPKEYSVKIPILDPQKRDVALIRVAINICPETDAKVSDLQIEICD
ncbi:MAG: beta-galactosidase, partial [Victivallales bacterium]|nr:beta-galactosidase [Victivallales bacterium]